jgi:DNA-binding NarL/FixJ family response regulator
MAKRYYTTGDIAKIIGISQKTVKNYCTRAILKSEITPITNYRRISYENLVSFLKKNSIPVRIMDKNVVRKVLIVDDEETVRSMISAILAQIDKTIHVKTADDGYSACIKAGSFLPDIIILDLQMPKMDGFEVLKSLKASEDTSNTEVIVITGHTTTENIIKLKELGVESVFKKPFDNDSFKNLLMNKLAPVPKGI